MARFFRFPDVGEGITEGEIVRWLVAEGDEVKADQPLAEIETDKAVVEMPSPFTGTVLKLLAKEKDIVKVGAALVSIGRPGEAPDVETACFRIVQEAVNNALRHGESHHIAIALRGLGQQITLHIQDDGRGFLAPSVLATTARGAGFGISSMRERAELLGGSFSITSTPGVGTLVEAMIPLS